MRVGPRDRPSGAGPKPLQAAAVKSRGRERWSKSPGITLGRYGLVRRTKVNPSKTRRYPENRRQNQGRFDLLGPACREPDDWAGGDRRMGGVTPTQAFARNCRNQSLRWQGRSTSGQHREARVPRRSTGADRSVVAMRALSWRRSQGIGSGGCITKQRATGGRGDSSRQAVQDRPEAGLGSLQGGQGQCRRRRGGWADDRAVRRRLEGQSLQDLEQNELGKLLSTTGPRRRHSEKEWRAAASGGANRSRSCGADGCQADDRAEAGLHSPG